MNNVTTTPAGSGSPASASAAAAAKLKAAKVAAKALRQVKNQYTAEYFAVGMVGIMALFTIFHWMRFFYSYHKSYAPKGRSDSKVLQPFIAVTR
jgi:hypothetical protein